MLTGAFDFIFPFKCHSLLIIAGWKTYSDSVSSEGQRPGWWASTWRPFCPSQCFLLVSAFFFVTTPPLFPLAILALWEARPVGKIKLRERKLALIEHQLCARPFTYLITFKPPSNLQQWTARSLALQWGGSAFKILALGPPICVTLDMRLYLSWV